MSNSILETHYEKKYAHEAMSSKLASIKVTQFPINRFEAAIKFIPKYFKGGSILELGAGSGAVAKTLLQSGIDITSYTLGDISLARVTGIAENLGDSRVDVRYIDAEDVSGEDQGHYDLIVLIALIEHLIDPLGAMGNIRKLLKPGGIAYIDTPNIAKYTRRAQLVLGRFPSTASKNEGLVTYDGKPVDLYDEGHLHYFTYGSLSRMLTERCGFTRVDKVSYPCGKLPFGKYLESLLATFWPEAFSELAVIAHN